MEQRYLHPILERHLNNHRQMAFLVGPRQVGKTTLALSLIHDPKPGVNVFNWDVAVQRKLLINKIFPGKEILNNEEQRVLVFDEIHKYPRWKNSLKGLFDLNEPNTHWIVTGSAMLNIYRRGQDSLLGRYFTYHLAPFSVAEMRRSFSEQVLHPTELILDRFQKPSSESKTDLENLMRFGGFPEPLFKGEEAFLVRWRTGRLDRLLNQDLAATENLKNLSLVEQLMFLLPERVGSPLSLNSLREDLEIHFQTVKHWLELLERVFYGFLIRPYARKNSRMLRKEAKWYLWDWTEIQDPGARLENLVAVHLIKYVNYLNDQGLAELSLHYVRDKEKREVDFLICSKRKPVLLIECKTGKENPIPSLTYFARLLGVKRAYQLTLEGSEIRTFQEGEIAVACLPVASFLDQLV